MDDFVGTEFKIDTRYNGIATHTVAGISDERWSGVKVYLVSCDTCSKDKEMYPSGVFKIVKSSLKRGQCCCGCSNRQKTEYEQRVVLTRECEKRGYMFKGFPGEYLGTSSTFDFTCPTHNKDYNIKVSTFLHGKHGCSACHYNKLTKSKTEKHIEAIMATGRFEGCTFKRNTTRTTKGGNLRYLDMACPVKITYADRCYKARA